MKDFFRSMYNSSPTSDGAAFHSLYKGVVDAGSGTYALMLEIALTVLVVMSGVVFVKNFMASDSRARAEGKDKIGTIVLIIVILSMLTWILATIFKIFSW